MSRNIFEAIKDVEINPRYDLHIEEISDLLRAITVFGRPFEALGAAYKYGYLQGSKAEKAKIRERKKRAKHSFGGDI